MKPYIPPPRAPLTTEEIDAVVAEMNRLWDAAKIRLAPLRDREMPEVWIK